MGTSITQTLFGFLADATPVSLFTLSNSEGIVAKIIDLGGIITELHVPDRNGALRDVVLGYDRLEPYLAGHPYFGSLIGRYANRIAKGRFTLDGASHQLDVNDGANHLHGGRGGFHSLKWDASADGAILTLRLRSPSGDQGYPGTLDATVRYWLNDDDELIMQCSAETDQPTPVNLTQHSYFNLAGGGDILEHELTIFADAFTPIDRESIPTGPCVSVAGTPFDFRMPGLIGERLAQQHEQLSNGHGFDHNFLLRAPGLAARLREPRSGIVMDSLRQNQACSSIAGTSSMVRWREKGEPIPTAAVYVWSPNTSPIRPTGPRFRIRSCAPAKDTRPNRATAFRYNIDAGLRVCAHLDGVPDSVPGRTLCWRNRMSVSKLAGQSGERYNR